jgi:hypothetical protein
MLILKRPIFAIYAASPHGSANAPKTKYNPNAGTSLVVQSLQQIRLDLYEEK